MFRLATGKDCRTLLANGKKTQFFISAPVVSPREIPDLATVQTMILADCCSRYRRMMGEKVLFTIGSEDLGLTVQDSSRAFRKTPLEYTDIMVSRSQNTWKKLQISFDDFVRTSGPRHVTATEAIIHLMKDKGDIYKDQQKGFLCQSCEVRWNENLVTQKKCPVQECGGVLEEIDDEGYYFKLSSYIPKIKQYIDSNPNKIIPRSVKNQLLEILNNEVKDICITHYGAVWGIPLPWDPDFKINTRFDSLLSGLTSAGYGEENFSEIWPPDIQWGTPGGGLFHLLVFLAVCLSMEIPLPASLFVQGWVLSSGRKISRYNPGNINIVEIYDEYGSDAVRYYFLRDMTKSGSLEFNTSRLVKLLNNELADDLGNLSYRSISMAIKYCQGKVPESGNKGGSIERNLARVFKEVKNEYKKAMDEMDFREALKAVWDLTGSLNRYINNSAPWDLHKSKNFEMLNTVIYTVLDYLRILTILIMPFMPRAAIKMWRRLGFKDNLWNIKFDSVNLDLLPAGQEVKKQSPLFPKAYEHN